jgi:hypothetical protein
VCQYRSKFPQYSGPRDQAGKRPADRAVVLFPNQWAVLVAQTSRRSPALRVRRLRRAGKPASGTLEPPTRLCGHLSPSVLKAWSIRAEQWEFSTGRDKWRERARETVLHHVSKPGWSLDMCAQKSEYSTAANKCGWCELRGAEFRKTGLLACDWVYTPQP